MTLEHSGEDFRFVRFDARGRALGSALAAEDVLHEIFLAQGHACLDPVDDDTDGFAVRFAEHLYPEFPSERIHIP